MKHEHLDLKIVLSTEFTKAERCDHVDEFIYTQREKGYPVEYVQELGCLFSYIGSLNELECPHAVISLNAAYITSLRLGLKTLSSPLFKSPPFSRHKKASQFVRHDDGDTWHVMGPSGFSFSQSSILAHLSKREELFKKALDEHHRHRNSLLVMQSEIAYDSRNLYNGSISKNMDYMYLFTDTLM